MTTARTIGYMADGTPLTIELQTLAEYFGQKEEKAV